MKGTRNYCDAMKNVTVSLDDDTYRKARIKAAALDTSLSALVKRFLTELGDGETDFQRLKRQEQDLRTQIPADFRAADNLIRDQVHERGA